MSSRSGSSSCLGSAILVIASLILIRFGIPGLWKLLAGIFSTALYLGLFLLAALFIVVGYYTYRNLKQNKLKVVEDQYARVTRTQNLYRELVSRLERDPVLNAVSVEELLQSEILVSQSLNDLKMELIRLKDFASVRNERTLNQQLRDYKQELQKTADPAVRQVIQDNLKMLEEKRERMSHTADEVRQKEAMVDLVYHSLMKVEEDLKMGRPVPRLLAPEVYNRFGLEAPREKEALPPLQEKSSE
jgi:hypothetical protein